ncbi:MAG: hypothetical protein OXC15_08645 [Rhodospirillaceae bacterium]|nr:hypothetical protein [Rhodospirillaceae bacterium]
MMVRIKISLDLERHALARARAASLGISLAEYVRRLIDRDVAERPDETDRSVVFDLGTSEGTDVATQRALMIGKATGAGKRRAGMP